MSERHLWSSWIAANALGELLGLGLAGAIGIGVAQAVAIPPAAEIAIKVAAFLVIGVYEGAIVGGAQWIVLRRVLPRLDAPSWVGATIAGAVIAWMLGSIPSALAGRAGGPAVEPPLALVLLLSAAMGAVLGVILGAAQWVVLRRHARRAGRWIAANAAAWAVGMPVIFLATGIVGPQTPAIAIAALAALFVTIAGAVVGAIEGAFLVRLIGPAAAPAT